jgi:GDPmannose 4,6-dehydratase
MRRALICGVSGQDGAYLASLLLSKGYRVCGTSRDAQATSFRNLERLGIRQQVLLETMVLTDPHSVRQLLSKFEPDEG